MHPYMNTAVSAARKAGDIIMRALDRGSKLHISEKSANEFVTEIDKRAEQAIIEEIQEKHPDHGIVGEESGELCQGDITWIIDPLDGTTNYINQYPHFAVSIGIQVKDRLEHGVIYDPVRQELFTASRGQGAQLNNRRLRINQDQLLKGSFLGTGFPYRDFSQLERFMQALTELVQVTSGVRRGGSAALDLAYVAAGRLHGYWEFGLKPWDIAAGIVLVREAGGMVTDTEGGETYMTSGDIVAGNIKIVKGILGHLN